MPSDSIFKKAAFGGFDRDDVMTYIAKMKKREAELTQTLTSAQEKNAELEKQLEDAETLSKSLKNACNSLKMEYDEKIAKLTEELRSATDAQKCGDAENLHSEDLESVKNSYEEQIETLNKQIFELKRDYENLKNNHNVQIESIKNQYEEKISNMECKESDSRAAGERVGTVMLDVRRYADMLIQETCEKINGTSDDVECAVALTLSKLMNISSVIQNFSDKMSASLADMVKESETICKDLSQFKGSLKKPFGEASVKLHNEIFKD